MHLGDIVVPTLAVAASWLCVMLLLAGCGAVVRRALFSLGSLPTSARPGRRDLWLGLAATIAYLQVWSLFAAVGWAAWLPIAVTGSIGLVPIARRGGVSRARHLSPWVALLTCLGVLWLADRALGSPDSYDFGLYHSGAIEYASRYAAIPGLGNLQGRLGAGNAHFLLAALLGQGPWAGAGYVLVNGLLVAMLFVDVGSRFAVRTATVPSVFVRRMSVLIVCAAVVTAGRYVARLSESDLDLAAFVLVAVGILYLVEAVDGGLRAEAAVTSAAALASASVTRPLFWLMTVVAIGFVALTARRATGRGALRISLLLAAAPVTLALGWLARQSVLSGYPIFPSSLVRLPVDWRMPVQDVDELDRWTRSWARWPGHSPDDVPGSWAWLVPWVRREARDIDVVVPVLVLCAGVVALVARRSARGERTPVRPLLAVVVPSGVALGAWFFSAPDPRFALAPIWLIPLALVCWATPTFRASRRALPVLATWSIVGLALVVGLEQSSPRWAVRPVVARGSGPFRSVEAPTPRLEQVRTASGLVLWRPAGGADRCWRVLLCAPRPSRYLRLRGSTIESGFAKDAPPLTRRD